MPSLFPKGFNPLAPLNIPKTHKDISSENLPYPLFAKEGNSCLLTLSLSPVGERGGRGASLNLLFGVS